MKALKKLDNRHLRLVCRSMKSAPSYTNYVLTGVSPIDFQIFSSAVISLYRLAATGVLISSSSLIQVVDKPTRKDNLLDIVLTNSSDLVKRVTTEDTVMSGPQIGDVSTGIQRTRESGRRYCSYRFQRP